MTQVHPLIEQQAQAFADFEARYNAKYNHMRVSSIAAKRFVEQMDRTAFAARVKELMQKGAK